MNNPYPEKMQITADSGRDFHVVNPAHDAWNQAIIARDKWWVEWLERNLIRETAYGLEFHCLPTYARDDWNEFKKELKEKK